jgi:hypothetical protein
MNTAGGHRGPAPSLPSLATGTWSSSLRFLFELFLSISRALLLCFASFPRTDDINFLEWELLGTISNSFLSLSNSYVKAVEQLGRVRSK